MPNKLPFGDLLSESFGFFFANLRLFFHLVTIPWIISLVLRIAAAGLNRESPLGMLAEKAIDVVPTVMFMVAWMRVVLMGPRGVERLPGLGWSARESAFLMHLIRIGGVTFLLIGAFERAGQEVQRTWVLRGGEERGLQRLERLLVLAHADAGGGGVTECRRLSRHRHRQSRALGRRNPADLRYTLLSTRGHGNSDDI